MLSETDKIQVFQLCTACFGKKVTTNNEGNSLECSKCNGTGQIPQFVMLREIVDFVDQAFGKRMRH
jgi:DnaJ-class molecular chaperone